MPSPPKPSVTSPLFSQSAQDIATRLSQLDSDAARTLAREARELTDLFLSWEEHRPTDETRVAAIKHLFELQRRAMDFLSHSGAR